MSNLTPDLTLWAVSLILFYQSVQGFQGGTVVNPRAQAGDMGSILGVGRPRP